MVTSGPVVAEQVVKIDEPRRRMASMAGSPSLENATRDLFRLSGGHSIPVEARVPAPEQKSKLTPSAFARQPEPASGRNKEASILFSLESLMRAATPSEKAEAPDQQLWNMQAETPLFGTSQDHALLTTPLDPPPRSHAMDSMTMSSRRPTGVRMLPLLLAVAGGCGAILAGAAWLVLKPPASHVAVQAIEAPPAERAGSGRQEPALAEPGRAAVVPAAMAPAAVAPAAVAPAAVVPVAPGVAAAPGLGEPVAAGLKVPKQPVAAAEPDAAKPAALAAHAPASAKKTAPRTKPAVAAAASFNVEAAKNALNAAAAKAATCGGAAGKGKVQLTFALSGKVSAAQIIDGAFSGTPAGNCALKHFRAAHVPAFSGSPQTVSKSFKIGG
jgi:hypothetical protein